MYKRQSQPNTGNSQPNTVNSQPIIDNGLIVNRYRIPNTGNRQPSNVNGLIVNPYHIQHTGNRQQVTDSRQTVTEQRQLVTGNDTRQIVTENRSTVNENRQRIHDTRQPSENPRQAVNSTTTRQKKIVSQLERRAPFAVKTGAQNWDHQSFAEEQQKDPDISPIRSAVIADAKPTWEETKFTSLYQRALFRQWDSLVVLDNVLYRKYLSCLLYTSPSPRD